MKERKIRFDVRLPQSLYRELNELAQSKGISLNALMNITLDSILHPHEANQSDIRLYEELQHLDLKINQLIQERSDLLREDENLRKLAAQNAPLKEDLQKEIMALLQVQPLSELRIAAELNQTPETVFLLLSHLEQEEKVKFNPKDVKWYAK